MQCSVCCHLEAVMKYSPRDERKGAVAEALTKTRSTYGSRRDPLNLEIAFGFL